MKIKFCYLAVAAALLFTFTSCAKAAPYTDFKNICIAKLSDGKYPSSAELEAASKNIDTWDTELQKKGKDIIKKAKTYETSSNDAAAFQTTMHAMAEYGTALGEFIDATK
jgi:hypothetical protein